MGKIFKALEKTEKASTDVPVKVSASGKPPFEKRLENFEKLKIQTPHPPPSSNGLHPKLFVVRGPKSVEAEQIRALRINLLFPGTDRPPPRTIMVTSARPGEGKTFIAANLAASIAQNIDEHVLLLDCDLRSPQIHQMFGIENEHGLSDYLTGTKELSALFQRTKLNKLTILTAGAQAPNPSELLTSEKMSAMLSEVKSRYEDRYIVIDTPPPIFAAESSAMAKQVDGVLVVVDFGATRRELVIDLLKNIGKESVLGVVVNQFESLILDYKGYGKYKKYSKYYQRLDG